MVRISRLSSLGNNAAKHYYTDNGVEIIDHAASQKPISTMSKSELKKFMVRLPLTVSTVTNSTLIL